MQTDLFRVIFTGKLDGTISVETAKVKLAELLGRNHKKVAAFFNEKPFVIKQNIDQAAAERYRKNFKKSGAICVIKPQNNTCQASSEAVVEAKCHSTKPACTVTTLDLGKMDLKFSPLTCNQMIRTSGGIQTHRPEKDTANFSEIQSVSICSPSGSITESQLIFFIKGLKRPVSVKYDKIKFSDFLEKVAISHIGSLKQFIQYLSEKCPDLIMDENTYEFFLSSGDALPKADPTRLSTAMGYVLYPAPEAPVSPVVAPAATSADLEKTDGEASDSAGRMPVPPGRDKIEESPAPDKTRPKSFLTLNGGLLGILLLAGLSFMIWHGYGKQIQPDARIRAVRAETDKMLCQLYLLYEDIFPFEIKDAKAVEQCDANIRQLIEASRIFIRYIDANKMYLGDEYLKARDFAIVMPLSRINVFAYLMFQAGTQLAAPKLFSANLRELDKQFENMAVVAYLKESINLNAYYSDTKAPDTPLRLRIMKVTVHGRMVAATIEKLRTELYYSYGSIEAIRENVSIVLSSSLSKFYQEIEVPMRREIQQKITAHMNHAK